MAKKSKPVKPASKSKSSTKSTVLGAGIGVAKNLLGLDGGKKGSGGKRRRKKSALFYAREIQRLKLKKRYEKVRIGV